MNAFELQDRLDIRTQQALRKAIYALAAHLGLEIIEEFWCGGAVYLIFLGGDQLAPEGNLYAAAHTVYHQAVRMRQPIALPMVA